MKSKKDIAHPHHEDIHDHNKEVTKETHSYWRRTFDSTRRAMSRGAQQLYKLLTCAHGDGWRRKKK